MTSSNVPYVALYADPAGTAEWTAPAPTADEFLARLGATTATPERQAAALETAAALVRGLSAVPGAVGTVTVSESGAVTLALRDHGTRTLAAFLTIADALGAAGQHYEHGGMVCLELASDNATWRGVPVDVTAAVDHPDAIATARFHTPERDL